MPRDGRACIQEQRRFRSISKIRLDAIHTRDLAIPGNQLTQLVKTGVENTEILLHPTEPRTTCANCAKHSAILRHAPDTARYHMISRIRQQLILTVKRLHQAAILRSRDPIPTLKTKECRKIIAIPLRQCQATLPAPEMFNTQKRMIFDRASKENCSTRCAILGQNAERQSKDASQGCTGN